MALSARFAVAVHTLGLLALDGGGPVSSERIAQSVRTNAVTIRRLFQALGRAGLVVGQMGPNGGARLARPAESISLADVWRAVEDGDLFAFAASGGNPGCAVSCGVQPVLGEIFDRAEAALERGLADVTLATVVARVRSHGGLAAPHPAAAG
jgi:Rrf2 family protein